MMFAEIPRVMIEQPRLQPTVVDPARQTHGKKAGTEIAPSIEPNGWIALCSVRQSSSVVIARMHGLVRMV